MYAKIFSSILDSSLWTQPLPVRVVWITMLAMADRDGYVYASLSGLARRALVSETDCSTALEVFLAPDPESADKYRNPENEGRKIEVSNGGWQIINYPYYRSLQDADERREQNRLAKQRQRERERNGQQSQDSSLTKDDKRDHADLSAPSSLSGDVTSQLSSAHTQLKRNTPAASAAVSASRRRSFKPPSTEEVQEYFASKGAEGLDYSKFLAHYEANGWKVGKNPMVNWKAAAAGWIMRKGEM